MNDPILTEEVAQKPTAQAQRLNLGLQAQPEKKTFLWKMFFLLGGVSSLFVWNAVLSLNSYWEDKYSKSITSYYSFTYMLGSFLSFFAYDITNACLQFQHQMTIFPTVMAQSFYVTWAVGEYIDKATDQGLKMTIFLIVTFIQGWINNLLQITVSRFAFSFDKDDISIFSVGQAQGGVGTAGLGLILSYTPQDVSAQYLVYLVFTTVLNIVIAGVFVRYNFQYNQKGDRESIDVNIVSVKLSDASGGNEGVKKNQVGHALFSQGQTWVDSLGRNTVGPNDNRVSWAPGDANQQNYNVEEPIFDAAKGPDRMVTPSQEKKNDDLTLTEATESLSEKVTRVIKDNQGKGVWSERFFIMGKIHKLLLLLSLSYAITLTIFPSQTFKLGIGMPESHGDPMIVQIYNVCDMIGRILYSCTPMKDTHKVSLYGFGRAIIFGGLYFGSMQWIGESFWGNSYLNIVLLVFMALTNGHFTTAIFVCSSERVEKKYQAASGFLCVSAILFGLMYGSGVAYLALNVQG